MEVLDMAGNSLNGTIPSSLTTLPALAVLVLTQKRKTALLVVLGVNARL